MMGDLIFITSPGVGAIHRERERQWEEEGFSDEHDDEYVDGELIRAAYSYMLVAVAPAVIKDGERVSEKPPPTWPWDAKWWKPDLGDPIRMLTKAGALIAAEIDRQERARG
jgi:hypothetical protein